MSILYSIVRNAVAVYYRAVYFAGVEGKENIPSEGGFLLCANHKSNNDPPFIASFLPRQMKFLAKKELFEVPVFGGIIRLLGAIPLNRGASDTTAIKTSMQIMRDGDGLMVFPQGHRRKTIELKDIHPGSVAMAQRVGVPIVPVAVCGEYKIFRKMKLRIGKPVYAEELNQLIEAADGDKNKAFAELLYDRIGSLVNE